MIEIVHKENLSCAAAASCFTDHKNSSLLKIGRAVIITKILQKPCVMCFGLREYFNARLLNFQGAVKFLLYNSAEIF